MRLGRIHTLATMMLVAGVVLQNGCGGSGANTVVDTVSPATATVVAGTVQTFTSTVTGSDTLTSTWTCTYVYTPNPTTSQPSPAQQGPFDCSSGQKVPALNNGSLGTWTITPSSTNSVLTYTAPTLSSMPNPVPTITFTAVATANKSKKGTAVLTLDTGIRTSITPATATVPTEITPNQQVLFTADFLNVSPASANAQWKVVQPVSGNTTDFPDGTTPEPQDVSCSPTCGTISAQGVYTAPAKQPTNTSPVGAGSQASTLAPTVYVVCWAAADITHYATATVTLVAASTNPLTFTGISPTTIPAGGALQDIWLNANNLLNTTTVTFTPPGPNQQPQVIPSTNIFTIPITAAYCTPSATGVTPVINCNASIVTRVRLTASQIANAGTGVITVNNIPTGSGGTKSISYPLNIVYTSPAMIGAVPDSYPQGTSTQFTADGGFYGGGNSPIVTLLFGGQSSIATAFNARQFTGYLPGSSNPASAPGLYPVSIVSNAPANNLPPYPTVTTDVAVQPVFSGLSSAYFTTGTTTTPSVQIQNPPSIPFPAVRGNTNVVPSSIAVDSAKGYAAVTEQGANAVQIINFAPNPTVSGRHIPQMGIQIPVGSQPTSIAIDDHINLASYPGQDLGVVVNSADYTLTLLALPSGQVIGSPINMKGLVQGGQNSSTSQPMPYAVGVDPTTHYAVVAFSNAFVGFVVDVNPNTSSTPPTCFVSSQKPPCAIEAVSMNTGPTPQVVMQPDVPLAYVTPGGLGVTSVVNLLLTNNTVPIAAAPNGVSIGTNCVVTITSPVQNNLNQSSPGSVLISGATPSTIDGTFNITSATTYTFTFNYPVTPCPSTTQTGGGGSFTYGNAYYTFATSSTVVGGAINPVARTFAFADPNASTAAPQVGFISSLDQTVSSLYLTRGSCNTCTPIPSGAPEVGVRSVAWDPFTNVVVAFNPANSYNEISLINPGGVAATGAAAAPYRIIQAITTGQNGTGSFTAGGSTVTVYGPMGYDPKTNLVLVANAGSNTLTYLDIDPQTTFKPISIQDVLVTSGGVASGQPPLASAPNAPNPLPKAVCDPANPTNIYASCFPQAVTVGQSATVRIVGQGFESGGTPIARLDGSPTGVTVTSASDTEVDVTIAASRLTQAHDFALDVISGSQGSNTEDLYATGVITLSSLCSSAVMPEAVVVDNMANVAAFTNYGCNSMSFISLDAGNAHNYGVPYGALLATVNVGKNPIGLDVIPRLGYAVVANYGDSSASIIQYGGSPFRAVAFGFASASCVSGVSTTNLCTGLSPVGVAIDQDRALALVANNGGNSISAIDLTPLETTQHTGACTPGSCMSTLVATSGPPSAIAVDPDSALAVVTNIQNAGTTSVTGGLDVINLATTPPSKTTTSSISSLTANPTGIVYDPVPNPPLFYATSTQQNAIYTFDPSSSTTNLIRVGVNPFSIAYNYQTGTLVSVNSTSNTSSVVDAVNAPTFATRQTLGISSQSQFAVALDQFTNTAVVVDQNNNRVLLMPMPR
jgi:DNA-binding beta-propeller fold protein YncE